MSSQPGSPLPSDQFRAYELGLKETDQVIAIQNHTATVATTFLVVTGAIWAALYAKEIKIPDAAAVAILLLHIIACLPTLQVLVSNTNAIALRFAFHKDFSSKYFPDIENIGKLAWKQIYEHDGTIRAKYFRWGRCPWLWYFIPLAGLCGSTYLVLRLLLGLKAGGGLC